MSTPSLSAVVAAFALAAATSAQADGLCTAPPPAPGAVVHGPVLHVFDGQTLCVALGATPDRWLPIRLTQEGSGPSSQESSASRGALMAVAFGQDVTCRITQVAAEAAAGVCKRRGRSLARQARDSDAIVAGLAWR